MHAADRSAVTASASYPDGMGPKSWRWLPSFACLLACGGRTGMSVEEADATVTKTAVHADAALPSCTWPATLDGSNASTPACVAARTYTICETLDGGETRCGINACNANEYAVSCGGPGPTPPPALPPGCRGVVSGPSGSIEGCCPCGTSGEVDASPADAAALAVMEASPRDAGAPRDSTLPPADAGTTFTFVDAGPDALCTCHYAGPEPQGACAPLGLTCGPPYSCGGGCGEQACHCGDAGWWCLPPPPC
jgi:hypothetical protein